MKSKLEALDNHTNFELSNGSELAYFEWLARPSKYFRTVSSTLVTSTRVTGAVFAEELPHLAVNNRVSTTHSNKLQPHFSLIPKKPHKTQRNREIQVKRPSLPVEICSAHQNTLERIWIEDLVLPNSSAMPGRKGWAERGILWEMGKR